MESAIKIVRISYCYSGLRPDVEAEDWPKKLEAMLPKDNPTLDVVIDSGGGPIGIQVARVLKNGGYIVCFGRCVGVRSVCSPLMVVNSTTQENMTLSMANVLKNQEFRCMLHDYAFKQS